MKLGRIFNFLLVPTETVDPELETLLDNITRLRFGEADESFADHREVVRQEVVHESCQGRPKYFLITAREIHQNELRSHGLPLPTNP